MTQPAPRRVLLALLASFLVYAIPLPGPHAVPLLGAWLCGAIAGSGRNGALALGTAALALGAQATTFLLVRWVLGARLRWLVLIPFALALVGFVCVAVLLVIPRWALIDRDTTRESLSWPLACSVPGASVHAVRSPPGGALVRAGEAWLRRGGDALRFGLMEGDGCAVREMSGPPPRGSMHAIVYAVPGGATLETTWDVEAQKQLTWWRQAPRAAPIELGPLASKLDGIPILSDDGGWVVVIERPQPPPASPRLVLRRLTDGASRSVELGHLARGTFVALGAALHTDAAGELASGEIALCRSEQEFFSIDLGGSVVGAPLVPAGVDAGALTLRRVAGGWVAWDSYAEDRPYAIVWQTRAGRGRHVVPRGRGINSLDVDADGRWLAVSTGPIYSLGGVHDDVIVISLADGKEAFRDSLPAHARSDVAFLGPGLLAYTAWEGGAHSQVRVVRAP